MRFQKRILLIEHDPGATREVRAALERTGRYVVREEHDERTAMQAARWFAPDLILLDFITSAGEAAALAHNTPVLCLSALENAAEVASAGVFDGYSFFAGPLQRRNLLRDIDKFFSGE
jgi:DNA-binding response OmpR family regulator